MKRLWLTVALTIHAAGAALAAPNTLNYQGQLFLGGTPTSGPVSITFRMFDSPTGGTLLWAETDAVTASGGLFQTTLGDGTAFPSTLFTQQNPWLEVEVAGVTLGSRKQFDSVPYALSATGVGSELWSTDGTNVWRPSGTLGIGLSNPLFALDVAGGDSRFRRTIGGTDFIVAATDIDVRLFSQANVPLAIGTDGDAFKVTIQGNGRTNIKNALGIGPATPWTDNGIYLDAGSQTSVIAWDNRANAGFQMFQGQSSNQFYFNSTGGGSSETWSFNSAGLGNLFSVGSTITSNRNLQVNGAFTATGTKCREVNTAEYGKLYFNAVESGNAIFTTSGRMRMRNGQARIALDPMWLAGVTIDDRHPLDVSSVVFYGPHGDWYVTPGPDGFEILESSGANVDFFWTVQASQKGYEDLYLDRGEPGGEKARGPATTLVHGKGGRP